MITYLHCQIHRSNWVRKTKLPIVVWQKIHNHLQQLDEHDKSNRNRVSEEICPQSVTI